MKIEGKVALVTGGARRLGRAFVLALADAGMDVVVHYGRAAEEAQETVRMVQKRGVRAVAVGADLRDAEAAKSLIPRAAELMGEAPRVLVNNAAAFKPGTVRDTDLDNWSLHLDLNLRAPFLLTQAFAAQLDGVQGKVVNISDWRAVYPGRKYLAYTLSKSAMLTFTLMAARELAPGIQVNALALGAVLPPPDKDEAYLRRLVQGVPARRPAKIEEVTDALLFLLRNDYVTGETIFVDGGAHLVHG
jgi:NAD(P)-dependent dehydrogenase (short-subunit alcohol dehydrogenase family)